MGRTCWCGSGEGRRDDHRGCVKEVLRPTNQHVREVREQRWWCLLPGISIEPDQLRRVRMLLRRRDSFFSREGACDGARRLLKEEHAPVFEVVACRGQRRRSALPFRLQAYSQPKRLSLSC